ncbi:MAG: signal peptide peptidase SppA [Cytophagales bacterium]
MWKFLGRILATFLGMMLFFIVIIFVFVGIGAAFSSGKEVVMLKDNSILTLNLDKKILEKEIENPFEGLDIPFAPDNGGLGLIEMRSAIANAKSDDKIKGIYLTVSAFQGGMASIEELRNALLDFKNSGKFIYAYSETYSEAAYYLASVSDKIFLNPAGLIELNGFGARYLFLKGTFEKLDIKPEIFKVGDYKSAIEPFVLDKMSDYSKEQTISYLGSMNNFMLKNIAQSRGIEYKKVKLISDSMLIHNPKDALKLKIVTDLGYYDEFLSALKTQVGIAESEKINFVSYTKYKSTIKEKEDKSTNKVAVIVAQGDINSGKSGDDAIGSDDVSEEIRKARLDTNIKAVVLRINSPGGSAMASDVMWREIVLTAKKKPIIASMSDVAASGGYYMAMGCTKIVAQPNSITGSIGVFGLLFNIKDFLKNKLGITTDGVKTGLFSDIGTPTRDITPYERKAIQEEVNQIYEEFTTKAAEARKMSVADLKKIASGRVWSGIEGKQNGLVDELGGLDKALQIAVAEAKLDSSYKVIYLPESKNFLEKIMDDFQKDAAVKELKAELGPFYNTYKTVSNLNKWQGIQARLPYGIVYE